MGDDAALDTVHLSAGLLSLALAYPAILSLLGRNALVSWQSPFLFAAGAMTASGLVLALNGADPDVLVGVLSAATLILTFSLKGRDRLRRTFAGGLVASAYLVVLILIDQAFVRVPLLQWLAAAGDGYAVLASQCLALFAFIGIGYRAGLHCRDDRSERVELR